MSQLLGPRGGALHERGNLAVCSWIETSHGFGEGGGHWRHVRPRNICMYVCTYSYASMHVSYISSVEQAHTPYRRALGPA